MTRVASVLSLLVLGVAVTLFTPHTAHAFSDFQIQSPSDLAANPRFSTPRPRDRNSTGIEHLPALFGLPPFGETLIGNLFYPSQPANQLGCDPFNRTNEPNWPSNSDDPPTPYVLLLQRGGCTFKLKVRNAQTVGAAVVIVYARPSEGLVYMADDDTADTVTIPSIFIRNLDGQLLINALRNSTVTLSMSWSFVAPDDLVEWDLWTSARDPKTFKFKQVFGAVEQALGSHTFFTPHYVFRQYGAQNANNVNCMNMGRYCVPDPNANIPAGVLGRDVVRENLRQICLSRELVAHGSTDTWWQYVSQFELNCSPMPQNWIDPTCGNKIINRLNVNLTAINACITSAPLSPSSANNHPVIDAELQAFADAGYPFFPTIVINEEHYRGDINCATPVDVSTCSVLQALCSGFLEGTKPDVCFPGCGLGVKRDCNGVCGGPNTNCGGSSSDSGSSDSSSVSIGAVIGIVLGGMVFIAIGIVVYMKRQKQEIETGMDHMLRQYLPMEDSESINHSGATSGRHALNQHP